MNYERYFFCGIGGSGMMPLASILAVHGKGVIGSDRSRDRGDSPEKFAALERLGIKLFPQDGSGIPGADALVVSSAVEESIPDVRVAREQGIPIIKRAELLAHLFNKRETRIAVAGTSGKSTVTGMTAVILDKAGLDPTVMNGGAIKNFMRPDHKGIANMRAGRGNVFVTETDESDGTVSLFNPDIAVLTNITLDHKSFDELDELFGGLIARAEKSAVLNFDDARVMRLAGRAENEVISYGIDAQDSDLRGADIDFSPGGVTFTVREKGGASAQVRLKTPGRHNVSNALAALGAAKAAGVRLRVAAEALGEFAGISRRMEFIGERDGITVLDDFAHNPDKIEASLKALKEFRGRLIVIFQPHGFGPLKLMGREIAEAFAAHLGPEDMLLMPEVYYAGGTAEKTVTSQDVVDMAAAKGFRARRFEKRSDIFPFLKNEMRPGDRVVVMGARDDTLSDFAREIHGGLKT